MKPCLPGGTPDNANNGGFPWLVAGIILFFTH